MQVTITIPPGAEPYLRERVESGEAASVEEAVVQLLREYAAEDKKLDAYFEGRLAALDRGEGVDGETFMAELLAETEEMARQRA